MPIAIASHLLPSGAGLAGVRQGLHPRRLANADLAPPGTSPAAMLETIGCALTIDRETFDAV